MTDTTTNAPQSWRELIGELSPDQVAEMEACERDKSMASMLVGYARSMVESNLVQIRFADVPMPTPCVEEPEPWEVDGDGNGSRVFVAWVEQGHGYRVSVDGVQRHDGTIEHYGIYAQESKGDAMAADRARVLGTALVSAADELDRLTNG